MPTKPTIAILDPTTTDDGPEVLCIEVLPTVKLCPECQGRWVPANQPRCLVCFSVFVHGYNVFAAAVQA